MKLLFPAALCLLLAACETITPEPKPGTEEHQRWLHEQARENFAALKAQERERRGLPAQPRVAERRETIAPTAQLAPAATTRPSFFARSKPAPTPKPYRKTRTVRSDDTIYAPTAEGLAELREWEYRKAREYQIYEAIEAKRLGKTPQTLTREERAWIRSRAN